MLKKIALTLALLLGLFASTAMATKPFVFFVIPNTQANTFQIYGRFLDMSVPSHFSPIDEGDINLGIGGWALSFQTTPGLTIDQITIKSPTADPNGYGFPTHGFTVKQNYPNAPGNFRIGALQYTIAPELVLEWHCAPWGQMLLAEGSYTGSGWLYLEPDLHSNGTKITVNVIYGSASEGSASQFTNPAKVDSYLPGDVDPVVTPLD